MTEEENTNQNEARSIELDAPESSPEQEQAQPKRRGRPPKSRAIQKKESAWETVESHLKSLEMFTEQDDGSNQSFRMLRAQLKRRIGPKDEK